MSTLEARGGGERQWVQNGGETSSASLCGPSFLPSQAHSKSAKTPMFLVNDQEATRVLCFWVHNMGFPFLEGADHAPDSMDDQRLRPAWLSLLKEDPVVTVSSRPPHTIFTRNRFSCSGTLSAPLGCIIRILCGKCSRDLVIFSPLPFVLLTVFPLSSQFCYSHFIIFYF